MANQNQFEGPFTAQLSQPFQAPKNPAAEAGYGGVGSGIMHFVTNFLEGASRSRIAKQAEAEMQRHRNIQALTGMMQQADQMGLAPEGRAAVQQQIMARLLPEVAGADNGVKGKDASGNPLFGFIKGMAQNLLPPGATKSKPIDATAVGELYNFIQGQPTVKKLHDEALQLFHEAAQDPSIQIQVGDRSYLDPNKIGDSPKYVEALKRLEASGAPSAAFNEAQKRMLPPQFAAELAKESSYAKVYNDFVKSQQGLQAPLPSPQQPFSMMQQPTPQPTGGMPSVISTVAAAATPGAAQQRPGPDVAAVQSVAQNNAQAAAGTTPFLTGKVVPAEAQIHAETQHGKPTRMYAVNRRSREVIPVMDYGGGRFATSNGMYVDLSKLDPQQWQYDSTAPTDKTQYTQEEISGTEAATQEALSRYDKMFPGADFSKTFSAAVAAARLSKDPIAAFGALDQKILAQANLLEGRKAAEDAKRESRQFREDMMKSRNATGGEFTAPENTLITKYRKEVQQLPQYKNTAAIQQKLSVAQGAMAMAEKGDVSAQGVIDQALISAAAVAMDPATGVRDAERVMWADTMGKLTKMGIIFNGGLTQGRMLDNATRRDIMNLLRVSVDQSEASLRGAVEPILTQAESIFGGRYPQAERMIIGGWRSSTGQAAPTNGTPTNPFATTPATGGRVRKGL